MTRPHSLLWALPLALTLAGVPALAQDAADPAEDPAPIGGGLSIGQTEATEGAAQAAGAKPETYIKTTHGDWQMQCLRVPEGTDAEDPCQMYQLLKDGNGGNVAEVSLFRLQNGGQVAAGGTFVVPLETLLTQKLSISVDGSQPKRYDFSFCTQIGCYARVGFTAEDVAQFKAGKAAKISITPAMAPDQTVELTMSLSGFTAAIDETSQLRQ